MAAARLRTLCLAATLALAACGKADKDLEALDRELIGNTSEQSDPALTAALGDQIVVDPAQVPRAEQNRARRASAASASGRPSSGNEALASPAPDRPGKPSAADCYAGLAYGKAWAAKLPAGVPLYGDAAVDEAAGNDRPGCGTRVVSYASAAEPQYLIDFYLAQARKAGWAAGHTQRDGDEVVAGERAGAAFYVAITRRPGGATVNIVTNAG